MPTPLPIGSDATTIISKHKFGELLSVDAQSRAFDEIERAVLEKAKKDTKREYGVDIEFVRFTRLDLPNTVQQAVFERMRVERERIATDYRAQGRKEADIIKAAADQEREKILDDARAEAKRLRGEGDRAALFVDHREVSRVDVLVKAGDRKHLRVRE